MRVLLISNSGRPFLEHARPHLADFLGGLKRLAFVTAASLADEPGYHERARAALAPAPPAGLGLEVLHLRWDAEPLATLKRAEALFVGGGNTYALLTHATAATAPSPSETRPIFSGRAPIPPRRPTMPRVGASPPARHPRAPGTTARTKSVLPCLPVNRFTSTSGSAIEVDEASFVVSSGAAGAVESVTRVPGGTLFTGWAVDEPAARPARQVAILANGGLIGRGAPSARRRGLEKGDPRLRDSGWTIVVPADGRIRGTVGLFVLLSDGTARELAYVESFPWSTGRPVKR